MLASMEHFNLLRIRYTHMSPWNGNLYLHEEPLTYWWYWIQIDTHSFGIPRTIRVVVEGERHTNNDIPSNINSNRDRIKWSKKYWNYRTIFNLMSKHNWVCARLWASVSWMYLLPSCASVCSWVVQRVRACLVCMNVTTSRGAMCQYGLWWFRWQNVTIGNTEKICFLPCVHACPILRD